jgi:hypothetical protein
MWLAGIKHGVGIYRPGATSTVPVRRSITRSITLSRSKISERSEHHSGPGPDHSVQCELAEYHGGTNLSLRRMHTASPPAHRTHFSDETLTHMSESNVQDHAPPQNMQSSGLSSFSRPGTPRSVSGLQRAESLFGFGRDGISPSGSSFTSPLTAPPSPVPTMPEPSSGSLPANLSARIAYLRFYERGAMVRESRLPVEECDSIMGPLRQR